MIDYAWSQLLRSHVGTRRNGPGAPEIGGPHPRHIEGRNEGTLEEKQRVEFEVEQSPKGPQAVNVRTL
jgi:hypothetical protein